MLKDSDGSQKHKGRALSEKIKEKLFSEGVKNNDFAAQLSISPSYLTTLLAVKANWTPLGREQFSIIADFLGIPYIQVMMLAEIVTPGDFFMEDGLRKSLNAMYTAMSNDPVWCGMCPEKDEWETLSDRVKILIALLYESDTKRIFLEKSGMLKVES